MKKVARDTRKGSSDAGLALEERGRIKQLEKQNAALQRELDRIKKANSAAPKRKAPKK